MNRENGLASRFVPYMVEDIIPFDRRALKNGDHVEENSALNVFAELGKDLRQRWEMLAALDHEVLWSLTDEQADMLGDLFDDSYRLAMEEFHLPESFDATIKRMAVIIKRIGAVLTVLRMEVGPMGLIGPLGPIGDVVYCSDEDFKTLVMLAEKLTRHAALMTLMLPEEEKVLETQVVSPQKKESEERVQVLYDALPKKFSKKEAFEIAATLEIEERSLENYLKNLVERKMIVRLKLGMYQKV